MTKDELKKEAEDDVIPLEITGSVKVYNQAYVDKQEKRIAELEAQIEKMKCCYNCKHSRTEYEHCKTDKSEKWEIKEK
jgi:hypothetical protein